MASLIQVALVASSNLLENKIFDISSSRDKCLERYIYLKKEFELHGYQCDTDDICARKSVDVLIFSDIASSLKQVLTVITRNPMVKLLYIPEEPPVISCLHESDILALFPVDSIAYWSDDFVKENRYGVKCNTGQPIISPEKISSILFHQKKFLVAITSSKLIKHKNGIHQERFAAFNFFSRKSQGIDLYGVGWDKTSYPFVKTSYRGMCDTKKDVLQHYKFSICFENAKNYPGLITEKIFDCFASGVVPIYYGAPNVSDYIPESCFINFSQFSSYEELYRFLINMTESEYQHYLDAVKEFIKTPEYYEFTSKRFAEVILEQVQSLMKASSPNRTLLEFKWALLKIVLRHPFFFIKKIKQCRRFLFELVFSF